MADEQSVNGQKEGSEGDDLALARLYSYALRHTTTTQRDLIDHTGLPPTTAAAGFERLRDLHLLQEREDRSGAYEWCAPPVAEARTLGPLRRRLEELRQEIDTATLEFAALREVYAEQAGGPTEDPSVVLLEAADVNVMLDRAARECRTDLLTAQPGGPRPAEVLDQALARDAEMLERGVRMRTLYQHSARFSPATEAYVERLTEAGAEVRTLNTLFPRMIVFDHRVGFVPAGDGSSALMVTHPDLVTFLMDTFDAAWHSAMPFATAYETRRRKLIASDMQNAVARLLLQEDKDAAIARRLGISERTCRQHVAKLMAELGARNRTHLGYLLATEMNLPHEPGLRPEGARG
ncbi:helix-turn-helix transcriptional regulator [Streptomyces roseicoloratus]|uniref:LuxR C-terminal-related transcriptional regulator n=1 Tax=Streptomyces roseicoloratus TaxID=2508722 RepID=A0ABY9RYM3_9ACTN|nr:LuxR C-terminal-related transcriptional regulator [Streptomyces roseicoloratus]WMX45990.1 LuxR C-terminal-related transcriptional regulator [Streptomyces roseicoloratus]